MLGAEKAYTNLLSQQIKSLPHIRDPFLRNKFSDFIHSSCCSQGIINHWTFSFHNVERYVHPRKWSKDIREQDDLTKENEKKEHYNKLTSIGEQQILHMCNISNSCKL